MTRDTCEVCGKAVNMKRPVSISKRNIAIVATATGVILSGATVILKLVSALKWERTSAVGWERYFMNELPPYADVIQVMIVAIAVTLFIGIAFFAWSGFEKR